ncbi:MAG: hypothetical protein KGH77_06215 [Candidatus Micrarchaeota archaeon]|nr:hypothetical protein [Candidatus Micrarchaeota archaeon]MDE1864987.1 hypothetical protein [Candidatus Micrarchaeota archaeon]
MVETIVVAGGDEELMTKLEPVIRNALRPATGTADFSVYSNAKMWIAGTEEKGEKR